MSSYVCQEVCLGVSLDPHKGLNRGAQPEPLGTVYRDTSIEWGMAVIDITDLDAVRYGIVAFGVAEMKLVTSPLNESNMMGPRMAFERGEPRVVEKVRPRKAMSELEYMTKFKEHHENLPTYGLYINKQQSLLENIELTDTATMDLIWPQDNDLIPSLANLSVGTTSTPTGRSLLDQAITGLIQSTYDIEDFDISMFNEVRAIPNSQDLLWRNLKQHSARLGSTRSAGKIIRLAFAGENHLSLEKLDNLSAQAISAALSVPEMPNLYYWPYCGISRLEVLKE